MAEINEKTKIGMTPTQLGGMIIFIFAIGTGFSVVGSDAKEAKNQCNENKKAIEDIRTDVNVKAAETLKMFYEIRASQVRIEEQLKNKQDKFK